MYDSNINIRVVIGMNHKSIYKTKYCTYVSYLSLSKNFTLIRIWYSKVFQFNYYFQKIITIDQIINIARPFDLNLSIFFDLFIGLLG